MNATVKSKLATTKQKLPHGFLRKGNLRCCSTWLIERDGGALGLTISMASEYEIEKRCFYEKKNGIVQLSPTHLVWTPDSIAVRNVEDNQFTWLVSNTGNPVRMAVNFKLH